MNLAAILHRPSPEYIYPTSRQSLELQLVTAREDVETAQLYYWERYETDADRVNMRQLRVSLRDAYRDYYRIIIETPPLAAYIRYCFFLKTKDAGIWFGARGFQREKPGLQDNFFEFLWPNGDDMIQVPACAVGQVYYQIFPERFYNGNPSISPAGAVPWNSLPTRENFMGGDIPGIIEKLDEIQSLGITCIYLTPIFSAVSNHKYDTTDYYEIDPHFGTKEDLRKLVQEVHGRSMKLVLDGVFNHCGYHWPPFQDVVKHGEKSSYKDWFFIHDYPVSHERQNYDCVGHYKWMPKLNLSNPETRQYFIEVGKYWVENFEIDGWRLDVADEVPTSFWEAFAYALRGLKPDCLLIGETWGDAQRLISGNRLNSAMNYLFRDAVVLWAAQEKISVHELDHMLNHMLALYPTEIDLALYNPLDSHDTARFLHECGGAIERFRLAVALQMTFVGCPAIFYGDEIGLSGANDPACRLPMVWDKTLQNEELRQWYRQLIALRQNSPSLIQGDFQTMICDDAANVYGYSRTWKDETTQILINAGASAWSGEIAWPENSRVALMIDSDAGTDARSWTPKEIGTKYRRGMPVALSGYSVQIYQIKKGECAS